jgi:hypothetical protein
MIEFTTYAVGKRFIFKGKKVKAVAETDSGSVKIALPDGSEEWTYYGNLCPIDGITKGFQVFEIPLFGEDAAKLAA